MYTYIYTKRCMYTPRGVYTPRSIYIYIKECILMYVYVYVCIFFDILKYMYVYSTPEDDPCLVQFYYINTTTSRSRTSSWTRCMGTNVHLMGWTSVSAYRVYMVTTTTTMTFTKEEEREKKTLLRSRGRTSSIKSRHGNTNITIRVIL